MDPAGLVDEIIEASTAIDYGRKGFAIRGKAEEGRLAYEYGISLALSAFKDAQSTIDPHTIILAEYTFLSQELQFCEENDNDSLSSLTNAVQSFDDAFLALEIVENKTLYQGADKAFPRSNSKYRVKGGYPKDSYHIAANAHRTRLRNMLRTPGVDPIEKALLKQRYTNLATGQKGYMVKQGKTLRMNNINEK